MRLQDKKIVVTAAAQGIGKATAISFAENGWNVGLFDINQEGLKEVAEIIGHNKCMYQKLDVTNIKDWIEAEKSFSQYTGGRCDIFFNNAGIANFAGAFEAIIVPGISLIIAGFYTKEEQPPRNALVFAAASSVINGFLSWAIGHIPTTAPLHIWQYLFLLTGNIPRSST